MPGGVTPAELLALVRGHGQVENGLHVVKDRCWDADRHYSKQPGVAMGFAVLVNAVVTVLRATADPEQEVPLRARADAMNWDIQKAVQLFTGKKL